MRLLRWLAGFFERDAQQSMTRLLAFGCVAIAALIAGATCAYLLHATNPSATVIAAMLGVIATLIGGGAVALVKRSTCPSPDPEKPDAEVR